VKFDLYKTGDFWNFNLKSNGGRLVASGDPSVHHEATSLVSEIRKYITRGNTQSEIALERALNSASLDIKGRPLL
jgi:hypothetical protein